MSCPEEDEGEGEGEGEDYAKEAGAQGYAGEGFRLVRKELLFVSIEGCEDVFWLGGCLRAWVMRSVTETTAVDEVCGIVEDVPSRGLPGLRFVVGVVG
jgi:hypothetical protein